MCSQEQEIVEEAVGCVVVSGTTEKRMIVFG